MASNYLLTPCILFSVWCMVVSCSLWKSTFFPLFYTCWIWDGKQLNVTYASAQFCCVLISEAFVAVNQCITGLNRERGVVCCSTVCVNKKPELEVWSPQQDKSMCLLEAFVQFLSLCFYGLFVVFSLKGCGRWMWIEGDEKQLVFYYCYCYNFSL